MKKLLSLAAIADLPPSILTASSFLLNSSEVINSPGYRSPVMCQYPDRYVTGYRNTKLVSFDLSQVDAAMIDCIYPGLLSLLGFTPDHNDSYATLIRYRGVFTLVTIQNGILNIEYASGREALVSFRKFLNKAVNDGRMYLYGIAKTSSFYLMATDEGAGIMKDKSRITGVNLYRVNSEDAYYKLLVMPDYSESTIGIILKAFAANDVKAVNRYIHPVTGESVVEVKFDVKEKNNAA